VENNVDILNKEVFAERLKEIMRDNNQTLTSLSERVKLSPATISRYTSGKMAPKITTVEVIAREFNVNPAWLMGYDVDKRFNEDKIKERVSKYYDLNDKDHKDVAKELEKMLEGLNNTDGFAAFDGEPLDEATKLVLKDSLERSMLLARQIAKQKFTPKKYRD
jgi:transcriptional regulator with XRE-family HTH domain